MSHRSTGVRLAVLATTAVLVAAAPAAAATTEIIGDTFDNPTSQHLTAVEPDTFASGRTIVAAAQVGRFFDGGASGIGFATSTNGGATWASGVLPNITFQQTQSSPFERVSDPSVAFDAKHGVWLVSSIPLLRDVTVPSVFVSRSTDGGLTFGDPVTVATAGARQDFDKNWTACDNTPTSPFYGNCYTTFDDFGAGDLLLVSTSRDGGLTWGPPVATQNRATGLGGQPVVQPNGTVIIPASNAFETQIISFRSTDGGASWERSRRVAAALAHAEEGNLRSGPLPSAEIDAAGKVYVVWQDCRFRDRCSGNDIVMSTTTNGLQWSAVTRVPIGATTDGHDNFIPGIGVDATTSGARTRLGVTFYSYDVSACGSSCSLRVGFIQSNNGGATWSAATSVVDPFPVSWAPDTSQGRMVGDYISTSWSGGKAFGAFSLATAAPVSGTFHQGISVPSGGIVQTGAFTASGSSDRVASSNQALLNADRHSAVFRRR